MRDGLAAGRVAGPGRRDHDRRRLDPAVPRAPRRRHADVVVRRARRRRSCSSWRRTRGTPTTTSTVRTCTPGGRAVVRPTAGARDARQGRPDAPARQRGYGRRPAQELTDWHGMAGWAGQERRFVRWAEANGIALGYATNADLATTRRARRVPAAAQRRPRRVLDVGHARHRRRLRRQRRQRRLRVRQHVLLAGAHRRRRDGRATSTATPRTRSSPTRRRRCGPTESPERPETLTGVSFSSGGYHRHRRRASPCRHRWLRGPPPRIH